MLRVAVAGKQKEVRGIRSELSSAAVIVERRADVSVSGCEELQLLRLCVFAC